MSKKLSRRDLLKATLALALAVPLAQACAPAPPPAAKEEPKKEATPVPKTEAPVAKKEKAVMSIATYAATHNDWQRDMAKKWKETHPDVELTVEEVPYAEMNKKQQAMLATGNLWDVSFSGIKWYPYSVVKGCFLPLDDLIAAKNPGMDDFFPSALSACKWDGKIYGLPYLMHPGNQALVSYNADMVSAKGLTPPTDDWTMADFAELATKLTDNEKKIFGTNYMAANFYDFCAPSRSYGGDVMDKEGKKFTLATDPKSVEAAHWCVDLRAKLRCAPLRADSEGLTFAAGQLATRTLGTYWVLGNIQEVGDKFKYDLVLHPKGPDGKRGWQIFVEMFSIYAKSKVPDLAYDLVVLETSKDAGIQAIKVNKAQPTGRKSVWADEEVNSRGPIYKRALDWMSSTEGPFPMPYNVRFAELQDTWANTAVDWFYGEVPFDEGINKVQTGCQKIMDLPRA